MAAKLLPLVLLLSPIVIILAEIDVLPVDQVNPLLKQSAFDYLDEKHAFNAAKIISVFKSSNSPYTVYSFLLNVLQDKDSVKECTLDVRQHEQGVIDILQDSFKCKHIQFPTKPEKSPEQEIIENIDKQIINESVSFDREVQQSSEHDRPFVAVKATQSDYCPGCPYELNPSLPGLMAFGNQSIKSMDEAGLSDFKHKLVSIVKVTRAVPPGANVIQYQLLMEIGESTCLKGSHVHISECPLQPNLPIKMCLVTFDEHPLHNGTRQITKNNCTELLNTDNEISTDFKAILQSVPVNEEESSTKTEFFDQIAQEAQEVFHHMDMSTKDSVIVPEIVSQLPDNKVTIENSNEDQKTLNFSEKFKEFDEFLKDLDVSINTETTTSAFTGEPVTEELIVKERVEEKMDEEYKQPTVENIRSKRSVKNLENNKSLLRKLAIKGVEMVDDLDDDNKKKHLIDVINVERERQDHGILYYITVEIAATDCNEKAHSTECLDEVIPGPTQICKLNIATSEKRPLEAPKLLHYECKNKKKSENRFKRQVPGQPRTITADDPEVQKFAKHALRKFSNDYQLDHDTLTYKVKSASVQVVAGLKYIIEVEMGRSTCGQNSVGLCEVKKDEGYRQCTIDVWNQAWLGEAGLKVNLICDEPSKRQKRSLRGQHYSEKSLQMSRQLKEEKLFKEFMSKYNKNYETEDEKEKRFQIFRDNLDIIEELQRNELGTGQYGVTQFADLTKAEFKAKYLGLNPDLRSENDIPLPQAKIPNIELPKEFDWRHYNVVTPVKNQGACGSCWAFSVTGNVEGLYAIKHGKLLSLSEQELVDCDKFDDGCGGGLPDTAYKAIEELGGLELESDYPYDAQDEKCHFNKNKVKVNVVSGVNITSNETQMAQWLVQNGPMSIGINANAMQFYFGGVSHPYHFLCSPNNLDHGVLIVGYGVKSYPIFKKTMPYWLIKNSWGPHWGEQGYYRIYRGDGSCGVNKMVTSAIIA